MNLGELLSELKENMLHDRSDAVSGQSDRLWSAPTLVRYINEAHRRFARKTLCIRDATTEEVCRVTLSTGVTSYPLHSSVLAVLSVKLVGDNFDLARAGHSTLDSYRQPDGYFFDPGQLSSMPDGKPLAFTTDEAVSEDDYDSMGVTTLRVYPAPSAAYNGEQLALRVCRLPLNKFKETGLSAVPEIPEDHHLDMLDWAAYLALRMADHDAGNMSLAASYRASFEEHVKDARREVMRKLFAPQPWGFGRNGFSWER